MLVDGRSGEIYAQLQMLLQFAKPTPSPEHAVIVAEHHPPVLTVGSQPARQVVSRIIGYRRGSQQPLKSLFCYSFLEPGQLGDDQRTLVGIVASCIEKDH